MKLVNKSVIETVAHLSEKYNGEFTSDYGTCSLHLNNEYGSGEIRAYETYSGISSILYDITLYQDLKFERSEFSFNPVYCIYCLEGYMFQKFEGDENFDRLTSHQSFVLAGHDRKMDITGFPAHEKLKIVMIFLLEPDVGNSDRFPIRMDFKDNVNKIREKTSFSDHRSISPSTAQYTKRLIENDTAGVVGRLYNESAILGILASQLQSFEEIATVNKEKSLNTNEIRKILEIANYIENNLGQKHTITELYKRSGVHPTKLQAGFKQLFRVTVNTFTLMARMERARELIETTDLTISEIIYGLGISSRSYFSKAFGNRYGISPSEYKSLDKSNYQVYELSYISKPSENIDDTEINAIISESRKKNQDLNITGCLIYDHKNFLQILEGRKSRVLEIFDDIKEDKRHREIKITWQGLRESRKFQEWSMALIRVSEQNKIGVKEADTELDYLLIEDLNPHSDSNKFWRKVKKQL